MTTTPVLAGSRQYGTFLTLTEMRQWLRWPNPTSASGNDPLLQRIVDMACTKIQGLVNRPVGAQTFYERHDGWSGEYIILKESPFLELVACTEWQSAGGPITLVESTPENPVDGIQINYATGLVMRTFAGYSWPRPFFPGSRNIEFTYKAGFNPVPPDLWMGTVELVKYWWENTQANASLRAGAVSEYDADQSPADIGLWPAVPNRIIDMIDDYVKVGIG